MTDNQVNEGISPKPLVIGLNKSFQVADSTTTPNNNSNTQAPSNTFLKAGIPSTTTQQRQRTHSPLGLKPTNVETTTNITNTDEHIQQPPTMQLKDDNSNTNNSTINNNSNNNNIADNNKPTQDVNSNKNESRSNSFSTMTVNNNNNNNNNNNSVNNNNNIMYNIQKQSFNKLNGSGSLEIFQFDEECEEELEQQQQHQQENNNNKQPGSAADEVKTEIIINNSQDNFDDEDDQVITVEGGNRSRSNGLMQELKLGTSLPLGIPSRLSQSLQPQSQIQQQQKQQQQLASSIFTSNLNPTNNSTNTTKTNNNNNNNNNNSNFSNTYNERKKYVTPRDSWVDILREKEEMESSFEVSQSLKRKQSYKSFI